MEKLRKTIEDIKSVNIQGAENIARSSVEALSDHFSEKRSRNAEKLNTDIKNVMAKLENVRPTEPLLRNCFNFIRMELRDNVTFEVKDILNTLFHSCRQVLYHLETSENAMSEIGVKKIEPGMKVFTHCHSSSVISILKAAKEQGKNFIVFNTETRPLFQGRTTAKELSKLGIPVRHYVDSGARLAIKEADMVLFGCDAITSEGRVVNKIGSEMFAIIAEKLGKPVYVLTDSWKFDPKSVLGYPEPMESRAAKEIWDRPPNGVEIVNHCFERIHPDLITAIISELGDFHPEVFITEVINAYPWLTSSQ